MKTESQNSTTVRKIEMLCSPQANLLIKFAQRFAIAFSSQHNSQALPFALCNLAAVAGSGEEELSWVSANLLLQALH